MWSYLKVLNFRQIYINYFKLKGGRMNKYFNILKKMFYREKYSQSNKDVELKIGDNVVVINKDSEYYGKKGKITGFDVINGDKIFIEFFDVNTLGSYFYKNELKKEVQAGFQKTAPFKSPRQEAYMWAVHPDIAEKWYKEHGHHPKFKEYMKKKRKGRITSALQRRFGWIDIGKMVVFKGSNLRIEDLFDLLYVNGQLLDREKKYIFDKLHNSKFVVVSKMIMRNKSYYELQPVDDKGEIVLDSLFSFVYIPEDLIQQVGEEGGYEL